MHSNSGPRRRHSDELKGNVLAACDEPGASISGVALAQAFLDVTVVDTQDARGRRTGRRLQAVEGIGYQFVQTRGLVVLDSAIGLVACMPVGMAQVSSVVITAEIGSTLRKGEEMGYFQFGGSDFVLVFEEASEVTIGHVPERHFLQGEAFANAKVRRC